MVNRRHPPYPFVSWGEVLRGLIPVAIVLAVWYGLWVATP